MNIWDQWPAFLGAFIGGTISAWVAFKTGYKAGRKHERELRDIEVGFWKKLAGGGITENKLEPGSVASPRLAEGTVTEYRLPPGSIKPN